MHKNHLINYELLLKLKLQSLKMYRSSFQKYNEAYFITLEKIVGQMHSFQLITIIIV